MTIEMRKSFLILSFLSLLCVFCAFSEEIEIDSNVITVDPEFEFFVIEAGERAGVEMGDGLIVHRNGEKVAEGYIIEVRPDISAAEILNVERGQGVLEGDSVLIVKRLGGLPGREEKKPYIPRPAVIEKGAVISIDVNAEPNTVFAYARLVLKENGYSIASTNRAAGIILATKPIQLSLFKELLADAVAAIDHKLAVTLDIKTEGNYSKLMISSFKEHTQKDRQVKYAVTRYSKYHSELLDLVSMIKERAEY